MKYFLIVPSDSRTSILPVWLQYLDTCPVFETISLPAGNTVDVSVVLVWRGSSYDSSDARRRAMIRRTLCPARVDADKLNAWHRQLKAFITPIEIRHVTTCRARMIDGAGVRPSM